mgnify:CR=1 FL=1
MNPNILSGKQFLREKMQLLNAVTKKQVHRNCFGRNAAKSGVQMYTQMYPLYFVENVYRFYTRGVWKSIPAAQLYELNLDLKYRKSWDANCHKIELVRIFRVSLLPFSNFIQGSYCRSRAKRSLRAWSKWCIGL